ncbi:MAG: DUF2029 domain-containing protein [Marmoricola sp.]|nr:DUF2029 domain-containing protein [Marmoricola sp.]
MTGPAAERPGGPVPDVPTVVAPTRTDPVATAMSEVLGGPVGRHARPHPWWTPVRVMLVLAAVVMSLAITHSQPCLSTSWSSDAARYGKMCYSDIPYIYFGRSVIEGRWPYADDHGRYRVIEYPAGIAYVLWVAAEITQTPPLRAGPPVAERRAVTPDKVYGLPGITDEVNRFFLVTAVLLSLCLLGATWFLAGTHRGRPWDALPFVLSPVMVSSALISWDLLAVVCVAGALWGWARGKPVLAGVMIGLGTAAKLYPLFLLGPVLIIAWRRRRLRPGLLVVLAAVASWVVAQLPALLTGPGRWTEFWRFNSDRGADWGSIWLMLSRHGYDLTPHAINVWSWLVFGGVCLGVLVLGVVARTPPRLAQLGFLVVAGFLVVNKIYSPQYALWLLPLAVLAVPRWRDLLVWQAGELFYYVVFWLNLGGWLAGSVGTFPAVYQVALVVRILAVLYLAAVIVRDVLRPEHDLLAEERLGELDPVEPGGGVPHPDGDLVADLRHR